jgi:L-asparagine transporter-like permease
VNDLRDHPGVRREAGLSRRLATRHQAMLAIGGAIGTGLFLGSGLSVGAAGPGVLLSYVIVAGVSVLLALALAEMCVAHPTAGSFGVYAGMYLSPFAGYAVRATYWIMEVIATGGHLVAVSIYMKYWFPNVPGALWIVAFSLALLYLNTGPVRSFAEFQYWFVMIKVVAVVVFVVLGVAQILGLAGAPAIGLQNLRGDPLPFGFTGVWLACCFVIYAFIGVEVVAVASGEAENPERTIPRALFQMVVGLTAIYLATTAVLVALMPWRDLGVGESPFVTVLRQSGIPGAAALMNFVVLTAALSAANANFYLVSRTLFSLARAGYVPEALGSVDARGTPRNALLLSSVGLAMAVVVRWFWPDSAYAWFLGVALFGALLVWSLIFVVHVRFRQEWDRPGAPPLPYRSPLGPWGSVVGGLAVFVILVSTWWAPGLRSTLYAALPWMAVLVVGYRLSRPTTTA